MFNSFLFAHFGVKRSLANVKIDWQLLKKLLIGYLFLSATIVSLIGKADTSSIDKLIADATSRDSIWQGPTTGEKAQPNKLIVYLAEDLQNGGALGVAEGVQEAAAAIGWKLKVINAGDTAGMEEAFKKALALKPDGFILGATDAMMNLEGLQKLDDIGTKIVAWHGATLPGPIEGTPVLANITSDNLDVASIAANYIISKSDGPIGVVIFTDVLYPIALAKARAMEKIIKQCDKCEMLSFENVSLVGNTHKLMPAVAARLITKFGSKWTHSLAINDLYFDALGPILAVEGIQVDNVSAGDGSQLAFERIRAESYQIGTVAEPLNLHGWQLIDELNRLFAGAPLSGYMHPVHLVIKENIAFDGGDKNIYDPDNGYREAYKKIWFGTASQ